MAGQTITRAEDPGRSKEDSLRVITGLSKLAGFTFHNLSLDYAVSRDFLTD